MCHIGGPGHAISASYSAVVMIIGGSGITFALSTIQDLVQKGLRGESRIKVIELVWIVQSPGILFLSSIKLCCLRNGIIAESITPLLPTLTSFMNSCPYLTISVHYTRPLTPQMEEKSGGSSSSSSLVQLQEDAPGNHIAKHPGRPGQRHLVGLMEHAIARATSDDHDAERNSTQHVPSGMLVGVCGPQGLSKDIVSAVSSIDSKMKTQIGGVEMHLEYVGLASCLEKWQLTRTSRTFGF
jgi:ferric-chelate reductase